MRIFTASLASVRLSAVVKMLAYVGTATDPNYDIYEGIARTVLLSMAGLLSVLVLLIGAVRLMNTSYGQRLVAWFRDLKKRNGDGETTVSATTTTRQSTQGQARRATRTHIA